MRETNPSKLWLLLRGQKLDAFVYILSFLFLWLPEIFYFCSVEAVENHESMFGDLDSVSGHVLELWHQLILLAGA